MPSVRSGSAALVLAAVTLAACQQSEGPGAPAPKQAPQVGVVTLAAEPLALTSELPGRTRAYRIAEVRPQVDGILQKRLFEEGSEVKAGQQLYQIDPSLYQAELKTAEAALASARSLADRYALLVDEQAVSRQAFEEARAARLQAEAALERAQINLRYTRVLAPIDGSIGRSQVTEGALVSNGQSDALATIRQLDPIYVDVTQPARELLRLRQDLAAGRLVSAGDNAAQARLKLEDGSEYPLPGRLEFAEVAVDEGTGSVTLRAVFPNPERQLLPGMFVHARLVEGTREAAILAPQQGVTRSPTGQATALVVNAQNKVEARQVQVSRAIGNRWLVESGLAAGDRLITEGLQFIQPDMEVTVVPAGNVKGALGLAQPGQED